MFRVREVAGKLEAVVQGNMVADYKAEGEPAKGGWNVSAFAAEELQGHGLRRSGKIESLMKKIVWSNLSVPDVSQIKPHGDGPAHGP